jgi:hypothetical protein
MSPWLEHLTLDPLPGLVASGDEALTCFVRRDLLEEEARPPEVLWELAAARRLVGKQQADGSWHYPGQNRERFPETNYDLLETFKTLGQLVEKHGFHRRHPAIERAAGYLVSCQTEEGDIRGIQCQWHPVL